MIRIIYRPIAIICLIIYICHGSDDFIKYFGTKRPYQDILNKPELPSCEIIHTTALIRHGTRRPVENNTPKLLEAHEYFLKHFKPTSKNIKYHWLKDHKNSYNLAGRGELVKQGEDELYKIGKRLSQQVPLYFKENPSFYNIESTCSPRTMDSARAFYKGFFNNNSTYIQPYYKPCDIDTKMRFYRNTESYDKIVRMNRDSKSYQSFIKKWYPKILDKIEEKIDMKCPIEILEQIFKLCIFEKNLLGYDHQWCSLFDEQDFKAFEYAQDIALYWERGHKNPMNEKIICELLDDLIQNFELGINKQQLGNFKFAHDYTILPLLTTLGLYDDEPLPHMSKYDRDMRKWRLSNISPFANNLVIHMSKCSNDPIPKLYFYHNEVYVPIPKCKHGWCYLDEFVHLFHKYPKCRIK